MLQHISWPWELVVKSNYLYMPVFANLSRWIEDFT